MSLYSMTVTRLVDQIVTETGQPARLTDIARRAHRPVPTVAKWLYAARDAGYIVQQGARGGWRPATCPALPAPAAEALAPFELRIVETVRTCAAASGKRVSLDDLTFLLGIPRPTAHRYAQRLERRGLLKRKSRKSGYAAAKARQRHTADEVLPLVERAVGVLYRRAQGPVKTDALAKELVMSRRTLIFWINKGIAAGLFQWFSARGGVVPAGRVTAERRATERATERDERRAA